MITITNTGKQDKLGRTQYHIQIEQEIITSFWHHHKDGLATCLWKATEAALPAEESEGVGDQMDNQAQERFQKHVNKTKEITDKWPKWKREAIDWHEPKPLQSRLRQLNKRLTCYEAFLVDLAKAPPPVNYGVGGYNGDNYQLGRERERYNIGLDAKNLLERTRYDEDTSPSGSN